MLDREQDEPTALRQHLRHLRAEQDRLARLVVSVERTLTARENGEPLMAQDMFDGFDHTQYREEVERRWGADTYAASDAWWTSMSSDEQAGWKQQAADLGAAWVDAAQAGTDPASDEAQALAQRHVDWLAGIPGTPGQGHGGPTTEYLLGLADMYVADPRFAENYGGAEHATFVRDTIRTWVSTHR